MQIGILGPFEVRTDHGGLAEVPGARLRKALPDGLIEGQPCGYRLMTDPGAVDAVRFERLVAQARDTDGAPRVRLLREALALWRGAAMAEVDLTDSEALDAAVTRLERLRLAALEDRFDAETGLGQAGRLSLQYHKPYRFTRHHVSNSLCEVVPLIGGLPAHNDD